MNDMVKSIGEKIHNEFGSKTLLITYFSFIGVFLILLSFGSIGPERFQVFNFLLLALVGLVLCQNTIIIRKLSNDPTNKQ